MRDVLDTARTATRSGSIADIEAALATLPDAAALLSLLEELAGSVQDLATAVVTRTLPQVDITALAGLAELLTETSAGAAVRQRAVRHEQALRFCMGEEHVMGFETPLVVATRCLVAELALQQVTSA